MEDFEKSWPDRYLGRKKLSDGETEAKTVRESGINIARSYILAGDRATIKKWIDYNKATM